MTEDIWKSGAIFRTWLLGYKLDELLRVTSNAIGCTKAPLIHYLLAKSLEEAGFAAMSLDEIEQSTVPPPKELLQYGTIAESDKLEPYIGSRDRERRCIHLAVHTSADLDERIRILAWVWRCPTMVLARYLLHVGLGRLLDPATMPKAGQYWDWSHRHSEFEPYVYVQPRSTYTGYEPYDE